MQQASVKLVSEESGLLLGAASNWPQPIQVDLVAGGEAMCGM